MDALLSQLGITLRLQLRNRMALIYSYIFPALFLLAFWVLYRYDQVPLVRHMGELLTVTALGGACFGLPTAMVSERERGVWRRYRLAPVSTGTLVASTVFARYLLLLTAGLVQLALAMALGMPFPRHPLDLFVAFSFVCFAFLGLGLVMAMIADNVPAVQALGQCIFLPMLVIGGVAVRLASLPDWALHLSAFFPGRYAVDAIHTSVAGEGLGTAGFSILALFLTGAAGALAGSKMFRWDAQQRFSRRGGKGWVAMALGAWIAVGLMAEAGGMIAAPATEPVVLTRGAATPPPPDSATPTEAPASAEADSLPTDSIVGSLRRDTSEVASLPTPAPAGEAPAPALPAPSPAVEAAPAAPAAPRAPWQAVTMLDIERELIFTNLPPDEGVVAPIASGGYAPLEEIECMRVRLPRWEPGAVADPVQRVRNYLYVAAVPDLFQMDELERNVPIVVFERIQEVVPRDQLIQILYWIAIRPQEGDLSATSQMRDVCLLTDEPGDTDELRNRAAIYAVKLLGRLIGKISYQ